MGLWTHLEIYQVEDVEISDLQAMNDALMNQGYGTLEDLYRDECAQQAHWQGPFRIGPAGQLEIFSREGDHGGSNDYDQMTSVWSCYDDNVFKCIASYLTAGKLVFHIDCEEPSYNEYYILTPGNVKKVSEASMKPTF